MDEDGHWLYNLPRQIPKGSKKKKKKSPKWVSQSAKSAWEKSPKRDIPLDPISEFDQDNLKQYVEALSSITN